VPTGESFDDEWLIDTAGVASVENNVGTARVGGITGRGFRPGMSGNPGGRPRGLRRQVRDLVGEGGEAITEFMFSVMVDESQRISQRMDAAKWLADRGFGRASDVELPTSGWCEDVDLNRLSLEELRQLEAIVSKFVANDVHSGSSVARDADSHDGHGYLRR
jgi:hypothetical protein